MKVSFFALPIYYDSKGGGGFVHTMEISANLSQLVQHVSIFMRSLKLHGFRSLEISPRLNVCETRFAFATSYLGFETLVSIPSTYESMLLVDNIMKKECFDVMINRFCPLNPWGTYLSKKYGLPLVLEVHSIPTTEKYKALLINRMIAQLKQSRLIITQTRLLKTQISKYTKKPIIVIPNGVNTNLFNPSNNSSRKASLGLEGKRIVAFSGSFAMWKGTDLILRIAREVVNAHPNVRFMVIGGTPKGVLDEFIWNKPKNLYLGDLKPLICFTGWVPYMNVPKFLAIADLCIHTAQSLNPIKLFEYMSMEKPIVAFDHPSNREIIRNAGVFARPADIQDFAKKIVYLLEEPDEARRLGEIGRRLALGCDWSVRAEEYKKVLEDDICKC